MTSAERILSKAGIRYAYHHFAKKTEPPYAVYYNSGEIAVCADDAVLIRYAETTIEVYAESDTDELINAVESEIKAEEIICDKSIDYIADEYLYRVTYSYYEEDT